MAFRDFFYSPTGQYIISVILGLGVASLFRKVCNDKKCIHFSGPMLDQINEKVYQWGDYCYKYRRETCACDETKHIVDVKPPKA